MILPAPATAPDVLVRLLKTRQCNSFLAPPRRFRNSTPRLVPLFILLLEAVPGEEEVGAVVEALVRQLTR